MTHAEYGELAYSDSAWSFRCVVSYEDQSVVTDTVSYTVTPALEVTTNFGSAIQAYEGDEVTLTAQANYDDATYEWYVCPPESDTPAEMAGTGPSFSFTAASEMAGYWIYCDVQSQGDQEQTEMTEILVLEEAQRVASVALSISPQDVELPAEGTAETSVYVDAAVTLANADGYADGLYYFWECMRDDSGVWESIVSADNTGVGTPTLEYVACIDEHVQFRVTVGGVTSEPVELRVSTASGGGADSETCPECGGVGEHMPGCSMYAGSDEPDMP